MILRYYQPQVTPIVEWVAGSMSAENGYMSKYAHGNIGLPVDSVVKAAGVGGVIKSLWGLIKKPFVKAGPVVWAGASKVGPWFGTIGSNIGSFFLLNWLFGGPTEYKQYDPLAEIVGTSVLGGLGGLGYGAVTGKAPGSSALVGAGIGAAIGSGLMAARGWGWAEDQEKSKSNKGGK